MIRPTAGEKFVGLFGDDAFTGARLSRRRVFVNRDSARAGVLAGGRHQGFGRAET